VLLAGKRILKIEVQCSMFSELGEIVPMNKFILGNIHMVAVAVLSVSSLFHSYFIIKIQQLNVF